MRYLMMAMRSENETVPDQKLFDEMGKFVEELTAAGILVATGGLDPVGMQVVAKDGEITVTDGPYTEAKETVGGFALIDVRSVEELHELSRRFISITGDGVGRIHQVFS